MRAGTQNVRGRPKFIETLVNQLVNKKTSTLPLQVISKYSILGNGARNPIDYLI